MKKKKFIVTLTTLLLFWLLLVEGDLLSLLIGSLFIALALFASVSLTRLTRASSIEPHIRPLRLPKFLWFFVVNSIKGGANTAKIAFSLQMKLSPTFVHYPTKYLVSGVPTQLFMNLISLLPGSVCVVRESSGVLVHVLNSETDVVNELHECEMAVCHLFGLDELHELSPESKIATEKK